MFRNFSAGEWTEKNEYLGAIRKAGFKKVRVVSDSSYDIDVSEELKVK